MLEQERFQKLLARVRAGEPRAAEELLKEYEPEIRRAVRVQLADSRLRRLFDSVDVAQSVFANFFTRAAAGQFDLDNSEQLFKLLVTMARNKLRDLGRRQTAARRDQGRMENNPDEVLATVPGGEDTPSEILAGQELLVELRKRLSADERVLAEQWAQGREWKELAAERNERPDALRKRLSRAIDRVARELGLEDLEEN